MPLELSSSYPSLSLPAQPVADNTEPVRASHRNKKPTQFFGNPLRHSVRLVEADQVLSSETIFALPVTEASILPSVASSLLPVTEEQVMPSVALSVPTSSPRKPLTFAIVLRLTLKLRRRLLSLIGRKGKIPQAQTDLIARNKLS